MRSARSKVSFAAFEPAVIVRAFGPDLETGRMAQGIHPDLTRQDKDLLLVAPGMLLRLLERLRRAREVPLAGLDQAAPAAAFAYRGSSLRASSNSRPASAHFSC